ncbi:MAG: glycine cleavage system aminomethyltransferase GcvT [Gammaproteobacteria bacterium]
MALRTGLYDRHRAANAHMVNFGGWDMPLHYGSQLAEHHAVRQAAGLFDVSHMQVVDVHGTGSAAYLQLLLANDVGKLGEIGSGLYSCMLNPNGGVVDDLIVYHRSGDDYRVVVNAATAASDIAWMMEIAVDHAVRIEPLSDRIMLATQGPQARERVATHLPGSVGADALKLPPFHSLESKDLFIGRTGYTGEDGWELILDRDSGIALWDGLLNDGIAPCGLGARDTLRLEAGLNLYGQDMDPSVSPLECGLAWTVAWLPDGRDFIGRAALERQREAGVTQKLVGLLLDDRGIMRAGQRVATDSGAGIVTSGGFSPTLKVSVALARVPAGASGRCTVEIRNSRRTARMVRPPFVRRGEIQIKPESPDD